MAEEARSYPLLVTLIKYTRLPWYSTTIIITAVLALFLILAALLDSRLSDVSNWNFWRTHQDGLITIIYILAVYPLITKLRNQAIQAFRSLLLLENDAFDKVAANISKPNRRWELVAALSGIAITASLGQPWRMDWISAYWMNIYIIIISTIAWGLLGWLIYDIFVSIARISRLSRQNLKLDILDTEMLAPIARWSLGISFIFFGGISLNLILETPETLC